MHAVLITAYKDYNALLRLVRRFDQSFFRLFIHVDKKSRYTDAEIQTLRSAGAEVSQIFFVRWGSHAHLQAILHLMHGAIGLGPLDYIHVISGQDYPLYDCAEFERRCDGRIYVGHEPLDELPAFIRERYELGDPFHGLLAGRFGSRRLHKFLSRRTRRFRKLIGPFRTQFGPYTNLYKGLVWCSFPAWVGARLLHDAKAKAFLSAIRNTRIAEEIFFPTYFLNSDLGRLVAHNDLRYVDWEERNGSSPAVLDFSDRDAVLRADALFMRKVSSATSTQLLDAVDEARFSSRVPRN